MPSDLPEYVIEYPAPERSKAAIIFGYAARFFTVGLIVFFLFSVIWVLVYRFTQPPSSVIMRRDRQKGIEIDRRPVSIDKISINLPLAVMAAEDQQFCQHSGFDWSAISAAQTFNEAESRKRGASTISMQTAKNAFLWPTRSWIRKSFEAYFTALIEVLWPKERIIEVYLNVAEWGVGIYGAEAAAYHYFGISASELTTRQAALLAAALPTPTRSNPSQPTTYLANRASTIEADMARLVGEYSECVTDLNP